MRSARERARWRAMSTKRESLAIWSSMGKTAVVPLKQLAELS